MDKDLDEELNGNNLKGCGSGGTLNSTDIPDEPHNDKDGRTYNQKRIVPVGVLIVLVTIYLGMSGIQRCFVNCSENEMILKSSQNVIYRENLKGSQILERLLEYKDICKDLEIFTKDINKTLEEREKREKRQLPLEAEESSGSGDGSASGDCTKTYSKKNKIKKIKNRYPIKLPSNGKNGFHKHNKSTKAKYGKIDKKELNLNKKNSTAEPIIYLFALVFIYLLLKAASDINQHYKSENKNDKRFLRRCSLQSYAQTHRDRRSSKELASKPKQQRTLVSSRRTISAEPQQLHYYHHLEVSPQKTPTHPPTRSPSPSSSNKWHLLRKHMTLSVDNSDITVSSSLKEFSTVMARRRCSVPVALNYQRQTNKNPSIPFSLGLTDTLNQRRTSITTPLDFLVDPLAPETSKRRVRMINRH